MFAVLLACFSYGNQSRLGDYERIFFPVCITISIFTINFSFIQYQFSPYRNIHNTLSPEHIWAAISVLLLALLPLGAMVLFSEPVSIRIMLFVIPIEMLLAIWLSLLVDYLVNPQTFLKKQSDTRHLDSYFLEYLEIIQNSMREEENLALSKPQDMPDSDWSIYPLPKINENDPCLSMTLLGLTAIQNNDLVVFEKTVKTLIYSIGYLNSKEYPFKETEKLRAKNILINMSYTSLKRITDSFLSHENKDVFAEGMIKGLSSVIKTETKRGNQTKDIVVKHVKLMEYISVKLIGYGGNTTTLSVIKVVRQIAQHGIDEPNTSEFLFEHHIPYLVDVIKRIGQKSIKFSELELFYRCIDALGWLGCSAIKKNHYLMTKSILQALVQLGREARHSSIECFWSHCAILPYDHIRERLWWIISWVLSSDGDLNEWKRLFSMAYSRLYVREVQVEFDIPQKTVNFGGTEKPYKENIQEQKGAFSAARILDYSDTSMLKEMVLH